MKLISISLLLSLVAPLRAAAPNQEDKRVLPSYLHGVGIDQNLNAQVPLNARFTDESGRAVKLGDYLGHRPAILALVYYTCPLLCDQILRGIVHGLRPLSLRPGRDFDVIAISINSKETPRDAAAKRQEILRLYGKNASPDGWHFLTGTDANIHAVADAVGYHFRYDPQTRMFFHAAGIQVLTPEGRAARYFYGVVFEPKDLDLGLVEASHNRIGSPVDAILLYCCRYDPTTGKYTADVLNVLKLAAGGFLALLVAGMAVLFRRDLRRLKLPAEVRRV
jgi:protein SCO1/2